LIVIPAQAGTRLSRSPQARFAWIDASGPDPGLRRDDGPC